MKEYIVLEFPNSQEVLEHPEAENHCHLINDEKGLELYGSGAYFVDKKWYLDTFREGILIKASQNLKIESINNLIDFSIQCVRSFLSKQLMDTNKNKPLQCNIQVDFDNYWTKLIDSEPLIIDQMYQEPCEGFIFIHYKNTNIWKELSDVPLQVQNIIINSFKI